MSEWVIVAIIGVVLLFSAKKLPDMARGLGQSMRIFKAETRGLKEDEQATKDRASGPPAVTEAPPATPAAPAAPSAPAASSSVTAETPADASRSTPPGPAAS